MYARFEIRQLDLPAARKALGAAIDMCPKEALFKGYIQLEFDVRPKLLTYVMTDVQFIAPRI